MSTITEAGKQVARNSGTTSTVWYEGEQTSYRGSPIAFGNYLAINDTTGDTWNVVYQGKSVANGTGEVSDRIATPVYSDFDTIC